MFNITKILKINILGYLINYNNYLKGKITDMINLKIKILNNLAIQLLV